jgi:hypothetical protein
MATIRISIKENTWGHDLESAELNSLAVSQLGNIMKLADPRVRVGNTQRDGRSYSTGHLYCSATAPTIRLFMYYILRMIAHFKVE